VATAPIRLALRPHLPLSLTTVNVDPAGLIRVSNHNTGEPYFGKSGWNRFDDPHLVLSARYGTSYFGESLSVAVAETLLHDRTPSAGYFYIEPTRIAQAYVVEFTGSPLKILDLTGPELRRMGGHAGLTGTPHYKTPQNWSSAIHNHLDQVDGFLYMSRHLNNEKALVLFERASSKLTMARATPLGSHPDFGSVATSLYIRAKKP
jgi:hypothetical protein